MDTQKKLDTVLNKTVLDLFTYSTMGYIGGIMAGIIFKQRYAVRNLAAGIGGSYGYLLNKNSFNKIIWFR